MAVELQTEINVPGAIPAGLSQSFAVPNAPLPSIVL